MSNTYDCNDDFVGPLRGIYDPSGDPAARRPNARPTCDNCGAALRRDGHGCNACGQGLPLNWAHVGAVNDIVNATLERETLTAEEREWFENHLRWHFNAVAEEGKGSGYATAGVLNAVLDVERIVAAREQALREEIRALVEAGKGTTHGRLALADAITDWLAR